MKRASLLKKGIDYLSIYNFWNFWNYWNYWNFWDFWVLLTTNSFCCSFISCNQSFRSSTLWNTHGSSIRFFCSGNHKTVISSCFVSGRSITAASLLLRIKKSKSKELKVWNFKSIEWFQTSLDLFRGKVN